METTLINTTPPANKRYIVRMEPDGAETFKVFGLSGAIGGELKTRPKGAGLPFEKAQAVYDALVRDKISKSGYRVSEASAPISVPVASAPLPVQALDLPALMLLKPVILQEAQALISTGRYLVQPKHDGQHVLVSADHSKVGVISRSGKTKEIPGVIVDYLAERFASDLVVLDGEWIQETFVVFDILQLNDELIWQSPAEDRARRILAMFPLSDCPVVATVTAYTALEGHTLYENILKLGGEGIVLKLKKAPYTPGKTMTAVKYKFWDTASVIVLGPGDDTTDKNSLAIGVFEDGKLCRVGTVSTIGKPAAKVGDVVEAKYLYRGSAKGHLVQAEFLYVRDDIRPEECTGDQLHVKGKPR